MKKMPVTTIAPEIFRKRLLIEGYFEKNIDAEKIENYFAHVTKELGLRTYGDPIIHSTGGVGKEMNQGFDAFVPLIDSGIYIGVWTNPRFLSTILYTCAEFDENRAVTLVKEFFGLSEFQSAVF